VWLEVAAISSSAHPSFGSGLVQHRQTLVLNIYLLSKAGQRLRAVGILMPHLTQSPVVVGNASPDSAFP